MSAPMLGVPDRRALHIIGQGVARPNLNTPPIEYQHISAIVPNRRAAMPPIQQMALKARRAALAEPDIAHLIAYSILTWATFVQIYAHETVRTMAGLETARGKIVAQLRREGWQVTHGGSHDLFKHPERPGQRIVISRHRTLSPGVARAIAKQAGWKKGPKT